MSDSLRSVDPKGRVDVLTLRMLDKIAQHMGPGVKEVWNSGLGDLAEAVVSRSNLPSKPIGADDVLNALGFPRKR